MGLEEVLLLILLEEADNLCVSASLYVSNLIANISASPISFGRDSLNRNLMSGSGSASMKWFKAKMLVIPGSALG